MSYFNKYRTRVIIFRKFQLDQFSHVILSCNNFGCWRIWIGVQCGNVPVKNNTCLFFSFQKGYLFIYIHIGRVDDFHSSCLNVKWPTLTHPLPSIVKRLAPTRHASPSRIRSVRHFVFMGPRWRSTILYWALPQAAQWWLQHQIPLSGSCIVLFFVG